MTEQEALARMVPPGQRRPTSWMGGVIQIRVTGQCDKSCVSCTASSQAAGHRTSDNMTVEQFEQAVISIKDHHGVCGLFGGNPSVHKDFIKLCEVMKKHIPYERRGIWSNNPIRVENARVMREVFNPLHSNLNVHLDQRAYDMFKEGWPECNPVGLNRDSRHSPHLVAMKDVIKDEGKRWELISGCDIGRLWSPIIVSWRGMLRAFFCEVAGSLACLNQHDPNYPDTGMEVVPGWWRRPMQDFAEQVRVACHSCGIPLRGYGGLACDENSVEQVSETHKDIFRPKKKSRAVELVMHTDQLKQGRIKAVTDYIGNARR